MFPDSLTTIEFFQKKKDITLYRAKDSFHDYILKSIITEDDSVKQAFYDEYYTLSKLSHPSVPIYYGISEHHRFPGQTTDSLTLCMEDCSCPALKQPLSFDELKSVIADTAGILSFLLENGILYTDLNPSNLLVSREKNRHKITLVDYTYCYYFLRNPYPSYSLRFSYDLSPQLKGQQFLIQALTYLFYELIEQNRIEEIPPSVFPLLETGRNPSPEFTLSDFIRLLV